MFICYTTHSGMVMTNKKCNLSHTSLFFPIILHAVESCGGSITLCQLHNLTSLAIWNEKIIRINTLVLMFSDTVAVNEKKKKTIYHTYLNINMLIRIY